MNNCGRRFHGEAAKFRFLNELIKLLTPKVSDVFWVFLCIYSYEKYTNKIIKNLEYFAILHIRRKSNIKK